MHTTVNLIALNNYLVLKKKGNSMAIIADLEDFTVTQHIQSYLKLTVQGNMKLKFHFN